jgi:hypothetical protein
MNYYQMVDTSIPGRWYLKGLLDSAGTKLDPREFCNGNGIDLVPHMRIHSYDGVLVDVQFPLRIGLRKAGVPLDFTFASFDMLIVSGPVAHLLLSIDPDALQVFPVTVENREEDSFIVNVTSRLACIDQKRSDLEWWTEADGRTDKIGKPKAIYKLVVDTGILESHHLFRVEGWEIALIASEQVKRMFEQTGVTGVDFQEV